MCTKLTIKFSCILCQILRTFGANIQLAEVHEVFHWELHEKVSGRQILFVGALQTDCGTGANGARVLATVHGVVPQRGSSGLCRNIRHSDDKVV